MVILNRPKDANQAYAVERARKALKLKVAGLNAEEIKKALALTSEAMARHLIRQARRYKDLGLL